MKWICLCYILIVAHILVNIFKSRSILTIERRELLPLLCLAMNSVSSQCTAHIKKESDLRTY